LRDVEPVADVPEHDQDVHVAHEPHDHGHHRVVVPAEVAELVAERVDPGQELEDRQQPGGQKRQADECGRPTHRPVRARRPQWVTISSGTRPEA